MIILPHRRKGFSVSVTDSFPFNPNDYGTTKVRLRAQLESYANNDLVDNFNDFSGNGNHFTSSGSLRPIFITDAFNGFSAFRFDGSDDAAFGNSSVLSLMNNISSATVFIICKITDFTSNKYIFYWSNGLSVGSTRFLTYVNGLGAVAVGGRRLDSDSFQEFISSAGQVNTSTFYVYNATIDWANSDANFYVNQNLAVSTTSFQTDGNTSATDSLTAMIAKRNDGFGPAQMDLLDFVTWVPALTPANLAAAQASAISAYGL